MIDDFKKYLKKDGKSLRTILIYAKIVEEFMEWYSLNFTDSFQILKKEDVIEFGYYLKNTKGNTDTTVKVKLCAISNFNRYLIHCNMQNSMVI